MLLLCVALQGCYEAAQDYLINDTVSWFGLLVGVGSTICVLLVSVKGMTSRHVLFHM